MAGCGSGWRNWLQSGRISENQDRKTMGGSGGSGGRSYASQRETLGDRASRRARMICRRLGGDPDADTYPDKPRRMRLNTYNRLMDKLVAEDRLCRSPC